MANKCGVCGVRSWSLYDGCCPNCLPQQEEITMLKERIKVLEAGYGSFAEHIDRAQEVIEVTRESAGQNLLEASLDQLEQTRQRLAEAEALLRRVKRRIRPEDGIHDDIEKYLEA